MERIALSHSRLSDYNQCPRKFQLKYILKSLKEEKAEDSPHLVRGGNVHKALENYIIKKKVGESGIPISSMPEVERTKSLVDSLFLAYPEVNPEAQVSVNDRWQKVDWFAKDTYYRAIIDLIAKKEEEVFVGDFKTGKIRDYDGWGGQLHLTATIALSIYPEVKTVITSYLYVDHKKVFTIKFSRAELPKLEDHFNSEHAKVNADKEFVPRSNEFCKWCPATKDQCPFSRKL